MTQHAASSKAMRTKIVEMGIVPQAVAAFKVRLASFDIDH
jgi:hypothetical protein